MGHPTRLTRYRIETPRWQAAPITMAVLSDIHVVAPWVSLGKVARIVAQANDLGADLILLPGDFLAETALPGQRAAARDIVAVLQELRAPLGVFASLGNHDWADCALARKSLYQRNSVMEAFEDSPIRLLANESLRIERDGGGFWLAGTDSKIGPGGFRRPRPRHDLGAALEDVPQDADLILMAHEPDLWAEEEPQAALTVSGHTHGGQIAFGEWRPLIKSLYGKRLAYGHVHEDGRHLVVSGGIGYSGLPLRVGVPPEIVLISLSAEGGSVPG